MDLYSRNYSDISEYVPPLTELINREFGQRILDLGCGGGELTYDLSVDGASIIAIDIAEDMIKRAKERFPLIEFKAMDILDIDFNNEFDTVFSNDVFHLIKNQKNMLKKIHKALKCNGCLICECGGAGNLQRIEGAYKRALKKHDIQYESPYYFPSIGEYATSLEDAGFYVRYAQSMDGKTPLGGGWEGMEDLIRQFFKFSISKMDRQKAKSVIDDTLSKLKPAMWDNDVWFADYKRIRLKAEKLNR